MGSDIQCCYGEESKSLLKKFKVEIEYLRKQISEQRQSNKSLINKMKAEHQKEISRLYYEKHQADALLLQEQYARQELLDKCKEQSQYLEGVELRIAYLTQENEKLKNPTSKDESVDSQSTEYVKINQRLYGDL